MMKKHIFLFLFSLLILGVGCKKDRKDDPKPSEQMTRTEVQVLLPQGSSIDLSGTKIYTLAGSVSVGSDGKANIPFFSIGLTAWDILLIIRFWMKSLMTSTVKKKSK